jgi:uncharacterized protein
MHKDWINQNLINCFVGGSQLYGTATAESDIDIRGVCLMPTTALLGLSPFEQLESHSADRDIVVYGLNKFIHLAVDANPNILDILFAPPTRWLIKSGYWQEIYNNRYLFLSEKVRHTFSGYAFAQLKRLNGHRAWLVDPPDHQPTPEEYDCWLVNSVKGGQNVEATNLNNINNYNTAKLRWDNYQRWLRERNPKRAEMERKVGYDCKHAAHLVRLLLKVKSILINCDYNPILDGDDLKRVLMVRNGELDYDNLMAFVKILELDIAGIKTTLQHSANFTTIEQMLIDINQRSLNGKYMFTGVAKFGKSSILPLKL